MPREAGHVSAGRRLRHGLVAAALICVPLTGCSSGGGSAQPSCTVVGPGGVAMTITADDQNPRSQCDSAEQGGFATDGVTGPWRSGSAPGGQPACSAFNVGITLTFYDPRQTGGAANDCAALQGTLSWQITWYQQSG
jgi:hypothetical protein